MTSTSAAAPSDSLQRLQAVLFDMDGTLVETEDLWGEAMYALAARRGGTLSAEARERTAGTSMLASMQIIYADLGLDPAAQDIDADARWIEDETAALMTSRGMPWRPGARDLLVAVRAAGLRSALVTTTPRRVATLVLDRIAAELGEDLFDVTVCGDEAGLRKPDPAPYLKAMADLGVDPGSSLVVEDSEVGTTAGLAAGVAVLGVPLVQRLQPQPGLTLRPSLQGLTVEDLDAMVASS
ncbi:HAD family hydrolase [Modestobacter sp. SSW1-42]|uniref:HAD family hydrolase n=1 Tax=Modestobacter sp. SSW1-42 TaxID=596372 RepID=UPI0039861985